MRSSFNKGALKEISLRRFRISDAERGVPERSTGLICTKIVSRDWHSRTKGVIVGLPR